MNQKKEGELLFFFFIGFSYHLFTYSDLPVKNILSLEIRAQKAFCEEFSILFLLRAYSQQSYNGVYIYIVLTKCVFSCFVTCLSC